MLWPKKINTTNLIRQKKKTCGSKIPLPHNFSNGPSLNGIIYVANQILETANKQRESYGKGQAS